MIKESIELIVIRIIQDILQVPITIADEMDGIREWDSMAQLNILISIENELHYKFQLEEIISATSVKKWVEISISKEITMGNSK